MEQNINDTYLWIGLNDRGQEGDFRLLNGTHYDVTDMNKPALYRWHVGEPTNKYNELVIEENCVIVFKNSDEYIGLNDYPCDIEPWNYDKSIKMLGLCEILTYKCIP